jgi:hypothetical protein
MIWLGRLLLVFLLVMASLAAWDGFHYFGTLNALAEMTQQDDVLEDFARIPVSLLLSLLWGLLTSLAVVVFSLSMASKLWPHVKRREPADAGT